MKTKTLVAIAVLLVLFGCTTPQSNQNPNPPIQPAPEIEQPDNPAAGLAEEFVNPQDEIAGFDESQNASDELSDLLDQQAGENQPTEEFDYLT